MPLPDGYKPVSAYLPPDILSSLTDYCLEHSLTRKDRQGNLIPSLGSGIVEALREFFKDNVSSPVPSSLPSALPSNLLSEDELMGKIEKAIKRDYEENRMPLIQARIDEWGRQLEQGMRESLRNELDSLRNDLEGKIREDINGRMPSINEAIKRMGDISANSPLISEKEVMERIESSIDEQFKQMRRELEEKQDNQAQKDFERLNKLLTEDLDRWTLRIGKRIDLIEKRIRESFPPIPPTPDDDSLPLAFLPGWEPNLIPPDETQPNSSNGEGDRPNLPTPPDEPEPNSALEETVTIINMDIPTEPNSTELDPIPSLTSQKLLNLIRKLKKDLKIKNPEKFNQLDKRIKAINSLKGVKSSILADANSLNREERLEILSEFRAFIPDSLLNSLE